MLESFLICYRGETPDLINKDNNHPVKEVHCEKACFTYDEKCFCQDNLRWKFQDDLLITDLKCSNKLCNNGVVMNPGNPWSFCIEPSKSVVFNLTAWLQEGLYYRNVFRLEPHDVVKVFQPIQVSTPFPSSKIGGWFEYNFGEGGWYKNTDSKRIYKYAYKGRKLLYFKFHHNFFNFELIRTIDVEHRAASVQFQCSPKRFNVDEELATDCTGTMVGADATEVEWDLIGEATKRQRTLCKLKSFFFFLILKIY